MALIPYIFAALGLDVVHLAVTVTLEAILYDGVSCVSEFNVRGTSTANRG